LRLKILREEGKREKSQEITKLEETVQTLKEQNEKERVALMELEGVLSKQKQRIEKQRRWAETQSSYRLCLERMIRDTMHQYSLYPWQSSFHLKISLILV
jgi:preprotein translocase subunit SecA